MCSELPRSPPTPFARPEFQRQEHLWFALMMMTLMIPYHVVLIPHYIRSSRLGWVDTYLPLIVPRFLAGDAFFTLPDGAVLPPVAARASTRRR